MSKKALLSRAARYLVGACLLLVLGTPLASLAFHYPFHPSPAPPAAPPAAEPPAGPEAKPEARPAPQPPAASLENGLEITAAGPVYDTLTVEQRREENLPVVLPAALPRYGDRVVYLTFDDGPDPANTPAILRILGQADVRATFFVVGTQAEKQPEILRQIYNAGHAIGNHSYNHVYRDLYRSPAAYTAQLRQTDDLLLKTLGVRPRISRAPGGTAGSFTAEYWAALAAQGYREVGWNVSAGDDSRATAAQIAAGVAEQLEARKYLWSHAIVLMHDGRGHAETVRALPDIIRYFKDRGFEFRVVNLETPPAW